MQSSHIHNSAILYPIDAKFVVEALAYKGRLYTKFEENHISHFWDMSEQISYFILCFFFFIFSHTWKNHSNSQTHIPIWLKFGTLVGQL